MSSAQRPEAGCEEATSESSESIQEQRARSHRSHLPGVFLMIESFETGGSERQFAILARSLKAANFRLSLGCIRQRGAFAEGLGDMQQFPLGGSLYGLQSLKTRWRLGRSLRRDVVAVAQAFDFYSNLTLIPAARLAGVPVVIGSQRQLGDLLTPAQSYVQRMAFRACTVVVCNSHAAAHRLGEEGLPEKKIVVIGNGLPAAAFANAESLLACKPGILRVGIIARMNTRAKGHSLFLRAAARVKHKFQNVEFLLVGDGPLREEFEREAGILNLASQVRFVGDQRNMPAVLASLDISVLPSTSESLSNAILESMAASVPVVASRVGGNPELVNEERGILFTPGSEEDLAAAIEKLLLNEDQRLVLGCNAQRFAHENFTVERVSKCYEDLYNELLAQKIRQPNSQRPVEKEKVAKSDQIRVAIVAASLRYVGGQSVQGDLLLRHWENDPGIDAIFLPIDPPLPRAIAWVEKIPILRTFVRQPFYLWELWRGLKGVEVAHIFSASYWSFLIATAPAMWIAHLRGKKAIVHYHSGEARDHLRRSRAARAILKKADRLIVPSGYLVQVFREFGIAAEVVPNIVDVGQFRFRERRPLRPHLICTRGFHPYYCVDVVVRAFAEVKKEFPDARLDLLGKGPSEAEIRALVQELKITGVNFLGVALREEIGRFYDQADIFVNASRVDNMPVSILEAFACGTPVVTTAAESIPYLVDDERTGLLSEVGDFSALARNVVRLLRDPALAFRLAAQAHQQSQFYGWTAVRGQWRDTYRRALDGSSRASSRISVNT